VSHPSHGEERLVRMPYTTATPALGMKHLESTWAVSGVQSEIPRGK
jgi:hypothetical protein